jgi:hypothetical protein
VTPPRILLPGVVLPPITPVSPTVAIPPPSPHATARRPTRGPQRHEGRFSTINGFVDGRMALLTRGAALVWLCLWRDTKPNGIARTSMADLAKRCGCDERTVLRSVRTLVDEGLVEVVRKGGLGRGPSGYRVRAG